MNSRALLASVAASAVLAVGCQAPQGAIEAFGVKPLTSSVFTSRPGITKVTPGDGLGRLDMDLKIKFDAPAVLPKTPSFNVLALPDGTGGTAAGLGDWDEAVVTLHSPTVSATFNNTKHQVVIPYANFSADGAYWRANASFGKLRPASDYETRVYLRNSVTHGALSFTRLGGSSTRSGFTIQAGPNQIDFTCTVNSQEASYAATLSAEGNNVNNGTNKYAVVKGDTLTFKTGIMNSQAGVSRVDVLLAGVSATPAYTLDGTTPATAVLKRLTTAGSWDTFTWDTTVAGVSPETYDPTALQPFTTGTDSKPAKLDVVAYNQYNQEVGRAAMDLDVFGAPDATTVIRIQ